LDDVRKSDVSGTDITIEDNIVLASGKCIIANEVNAGSAGVGTLQKQTCGGEFININIAAAVTGNLVVGGAVNGVARSLKSNNVESDYAANANNTSFVGSITLQVNGDLSVGSNDTHAENVNSNLHVKTKYLEATADAGDNQITVMSDLAMLILLKTRN
jgi:hypothetical protein